MIGQYFDADPRHGGISIELTVSITQQRAYEGGDWGNAGAAAAKSEGGTCSSTNNDCGWRPDFSYSTPKAKAWLNSDKQLDGQALNVDGNGMYTVQFGDSLSGIAKRQLVGQGNDSPNKQDIQGAISQIVQSNHDRYPSLDCNTDLVKTGWKLVIPTGNGAEQAPPPPEQPVQQPSQPVEQPVEQPAAPQRHDCPDNGGQVNEYHINNAYFNDNARSWAPDAPINGEQSWQQPQQQVPQDQYFQGRQPYANYEQENPMWPPQNYYARPGVNFEMGVMPHHHRFMMPYRPMPFMPMPFVGAGVRIGGRGGLSIGLGF